MNKLFVLLIFVLGTMTLSGQTNMVLVEESTIIKSAQQLEYYKKKDELQTSKILLLEAKNLEYEKLLENQQSIMLKKDKRIGIYSGMVNKYITMPVTNDVKFYETKTFNFISGIVIGAGSIYLGSKLGI